MQSTKPLYTSIRNIPAGRLLGNADGATGPAQALGDVAARALLGLGTAALAATGDFDAAGAAASVASSLSAHVAAADPHGDRAYAASLVSGLSAVYQPLDSDLTAIAALSTTTYGRALLTLADAAAGQSALGLGNSALATVLATGTDRSVQVRNGTGNSYTDSLLTVAGTTGVASLTGTAAAYLAYGPTGVPYTSLSHDGTSGVLATSSGDLTLSPASGITALAASQKIKWGAAGTGMQLSLTVGTNPQLDVRNFDNTIYGRVRAHTYYMWDGSFLYTDGTAFSTHKSNGSTYSGIYTGTHRVYDQSLNTAYLALSHNGTDAYLTPSTGSVVIPDGTVSDPGFVFSGSSGLNTGFFKQSGGSGGPVVAVGGVECLLINSSAEIRAKSSGMFSVSSGAPTAAVADIAWARRAAGAWEANNGTPGTLRDVYARTFYGVAQAATDTPGCDKGAASQSANLREWQDSTGAVLASVSENGYFTTRKNAAPADAEIATGESAYWFDSTNGAAKFMIKAKQADGTVVTGSVALA